MATVFVILDTITGKFIERSKVVYWNLDTLENAHTWNTHREAEIQVNNMLRTLSRHNSSLPAGHPKRDVSFEIRPATLTLDK